MKTSPHTQTLNSPSVALVSGFWGQNIGNAFFNIGGKWVLDQVFGSDRVAFIQDQPGYRTFNNQQKGNPKNDIELLRYLDVDYIVLQGPLLTRGMSHLWHRTFDALLSRNTKLLLLGAAFFKFDAQEIQEARLFVEKFPPHLIVTRDTRSYEILKSWKLDVPIYDGLDSAFFVPRAFRAFKLTGPDYYAFNFDRYPEPTISFGASSQRSDIAFDFDAVRWNLRFPKLVSRLARRSKAAAYLGHLLDARELPESANGRMIIRPEHRYNPHMTYKIYQHKNAMASDEPWTYFTTYANSKLTLADRVHACVTTLAFGNPAMLFTPSPRAALFERVGCGDIRNRPVWLEPAYLEEEHEKQLRWLRANI